MPIVHVTEETFDDVTQEGIVLLDWWAAWCGPCRMFAPIFEAAAARHPDVTFGKIDTEAQPMLAASFGIRSIPTLMAFRDGLILLAQPGMVSARTLDELVAAVKELDMDEVRRMVAEKAREAEGASG